MSHKTKTVFFIIVIAIVLILYPYSKQPAKFRSDDITWQIFSNSKMHKKFDSHNFEFITINQINDEIKALDKNEISIKGFIVVENHGKHKHIILSETVTDACFMCNHDENNPAILLFPNDDKSEIYNLKQDDFVKIKGTFAINKTNPNLMTFILKNAEIVKNENLK